MWKQSDSSNKKYISFDGKMPAYLYRYRSISEANMESRINFEILEETIYLAGLGELNDPDEGRFSMTFGGDREKIFDYWCAAIAATDSTLSAEAIKIIAKSHTDELVLTGFKIPYHVVAHTRQSLEQLLRAACFTTQPLNYSMWANYAKYSDKAGCTEGHGGICIEYACGEGWRNTTLHPVKYTDVIPEIDIVSRSESDLVQVLYTKAREWRCEEEWRITSVIQATHPFPANLVANSKVKIKNAVVGMIFGLNTPDSVMELFRSKILPHRPHMSFKKVVKDIRNFERKIVTL